jgi:hypothetical protein
VSNRGCCPRVREQTAPWAIHRCCRSSHTRPGSQSSLRVGSRNESGPYRLRTFSEGGFLSRVQRIYASTRPRPRAPRLRGGMRTRPKAGQTGTRSSLQSPGTIRLEGRPRNAHPNKKANSNQNDKPVMAICRFSSRQVRINIRTSARDTVRSRKVP